jgi:hypothetical protein
MVVCVRWRAGPFLGPGNGFCPSLTFETLFATSLRPRRRCKHFQPQPFWKFPARIRDRRLLKLNSFTGVRCSPTPAVPTSRSSPSHGGLKNSEFPMPRWLAVRGFTCLEVLLRLDGGNDSRNFDGEYSRSATTQAEFLSPVSDAHQTPAAPRSRWRRHRLASFEGRNSLPNLVLTGFLGRSHSRGFGNHRGHDRRVNCNSLGGVPLPPRPNSPEIVGCAFRNLKLAFLGEEWPRYRGTSTRGGATRRSTRRTAPKRERPGFASDSVSGEFEAPGRFSLRRLAGWPLSSVQRYVPEVR